MIMIMGLFGVRTNVTSRVNHGTADTANGTVVSEYKGQEKFSNNVMHPPCNLRITQVSGVCSLPGRIGTISFAIWFVIFI